ncbi:hypothetical protein BDF22DRAFT_694437 [Syncephalis plumigaleata]|nr:hypothetical protein BDF22DRAFT_694437 [Syncephalis plumigaleata]
MYKLIPTILLSVVACSSLVFAQGHLPPVKQIVSYGDSLTDTGNIYALSDKIFPDGRFYYPGRFSNGPVWVEWLQQYTNSTLTNWAFSGASTDSDFIQGVTGAWPHTVKAPGFKQQVEDYYIPNISKTQVAPQKNTLHAIWFGGVDYMRATELRFSVDDEFVQHVVRNLVNTMQTLHDRVGATRFLLLNVPSYSASPVAKMLPSFLSRSLEKRLPHHDAVLREALMHFEEKNPDAHATLLDYRQFEANIQNHPSTYNITNSDSGCLSLLTWRKCPNEDNYYYYDSTHPSTAVHRLLARSIFDWLNSP